MKTHFILVAIFLLIGIHSTAQNTWYEFRFDQIDSLLKEGLPREASVIYDSIYSKAMAENNDIMLVRSVIGQCESLFSLEEEPLVKVIDRLEADAGKAKTPIHQIFHSVIAESYWKYYQQNRWRFHNRTATEQPIGNDITTWDLTRIAQEAIKHTQLSLVDDLKLQKTTANEFSSLLIGDSTLRNLRPTLYDLLAHRALQLLANGEIGLLKPTDTFALNDPKYFLPANDFAKIEISTTDTTSMRYQSIDLYRKLTQFRLNDSNLEALIELEMNRIDYVFLNSSLDGKDSLTVHFYENLLSQKHSDETMAEVMFRLAEFYFNNRQENSQDQLIKSMELIDRILTQFPSAKAASYASTMKETIEQPYLNLSAENVERPGLPFRMLINWKNIDNVHFTAYRLSGSQVLKFQQQWKFTYDSVASLPIFRSWDEPLLKQKYYINHSAEIAVDGFPAGIYIIVASETADIKNSRFQNAALVQFSSLTVMSRGDKNGKMFVVSDAFSGKPVAKATVQLSKYEYNYNDRKRTKHKVTDLITNEQGECHYVAGHNDQYLVTVVNGNDTLLAGNEYIGQFYDFDNFTNQQQSITFYTDRAIYRPGQMVHFKGIVLKRIRKETHIVDKYKQTIKLMDVNWQEVSSLTLTTNEYGTFSGSFVLPSSGLNGSYTIFTELGSTNIQVEEYRRPSYEMIFDEPLKSYSFNDTIVVTGWLKAFSGTPIQGANVNFQVVRTEANYWGRWFNPIPEKVISTEETVSKDDGSFSVSFIAMSNDIDDLDRIIQYTIKADATDGNGESTHNEFSLRISNSNLLINCDLPEVVHGDTFSGATIKTTNLNGKEVAATVSISISQLKAPSYFIHNRHWVAPDTFLLEEKTFKTKFPTYPYRNEQLPENWQVKNVSYNQSVILPIPDKLPLKEWRISEPGYYRVDIEASSTDGKQKAKWYRTVRLIGQKPSPAQCTEDWVTPVKLTGEPGEVAEIWITALNAESPVRYELVNGQDIITKEIFYPSKKAFRLQIPINETYRGNVTAQFTHVANNRNYTKQLEIIVPHTNKMLDINFSSFRDELLPGESEKWALKLTDKTGKGVVAEMVAALYDASLEQFVQHSWSTNFLQNNYNRYYTWNTNIVVPNAKQLSYSKNIEGPLYWEKQYEMLQLLDFYAQQNYKVMKGEGRVMIRGIQIQNDAVEEEVFFASSPKLKETVSVAYETTGAVANISVAADVDLDVKREESVPSHQGEKPDFSSVNVRTNFNETAFFYPNLYSDVDGSLELSFTIPEAITRWRMMGFAHTKDMMQGEISRELVTRKKVSVSAYAPRFLRESDTVSITAKITNRTNDSLIGTAMLQWIDAVTLQPISEKLLKTDSLLNFSIAPNNNTVAQWQVIVPAGLQAVTYKVYAIAQNHSDGEQKTIPVLTNRQLVTESLPFMVRGGEQKEFVFEKMLNNKSESLVNNSYTLEYTSNPAWYAIQALPYLMEYPYECAEQVFSRFYANAVSSAMVNSSPKIKAIFDSWKNLDASALLSNLEKNSELKSVLLQESPWLLNAQSESEAKKRIALLFDLNTMGNELSRALTRLKQMQTPNGGFPWFSGMPDNEFITLHIVKGMGEMKTMNCVDKKWQNDFDNILQKAIVYLDKRMEESYNELLIRSKKDSTLLAEYKPSMEEIYYLYARSFYPEIELSGNAAKIFQYYYAQVKKNWLTYNEYAQGHIALTANRQNDNSMARRILKSLSDKAIRSKDDGMFWKNNVGGYYWYQAPIETQALLITAFNEINYDAKAVEEMKIWLLRQKQTTHWKTTKATLSACYSLLSKGYNLLADQKPLSVKLNDKPIEKLREINPEAGTGYVKTSFAAAEIAPELAKISVENQNNGIAWGAAYWQYFEQLDKITAAKTDVQIKKQLFLKMKTEKGNVLRTISEKDPIAVGDEVVVRIEITTLRNMEYVHLKDLRASAFEPVTTISGYKWQDGLGYYSEVKDAAMNFFIGYLPKGSYVFEYSLRAAHSGQFSNGITTMQCMYAPEFTTQSEGIRIKVEQ